MDHLERDSKLAFDQRGDEYWLGPYSEPDEPKCFHCYEPERDNPAAPWSCIWCGHGICY